MTSGLPSCGIRGPHSGHSPCAQYGRDEHEVSRPRLVEHLQLNRASVAMSVANEKGFIAV
jgi:hypothetical protein